MAKVESIAPPPSYIYDDDEFTVRVTDKDGEEPTAAIAFFALCRAALDILSTEDSEE